MKTYTITENICIADYKMSVNDIINTLLEDYRKIYDDVKMIEQHSDGKVLTVIWECN